MCEGRLWEETILKRTCFFCLGFLSKSKFCLLKSCVIHACGPDTACWADAQGRGLWSSSTSWLPQHRTGAMIWLLQSSYLKVHTGVFKTNRAMVPFFQEGNRGECLFWKRRIALFLLQTLLRPSSSTPGVPVLELIVPSRGGVKGQLCSSYSHWGTSVILFKA